MNTAELTALHTETLNEARRARLLTNITRRAETLFTTGGYTATQTMDGQYAACFLVVSPEGRRYTVKVSRTMAAPGTFYGSKCSCPCFEKELTCKHLLACTARVEADAAAEAQAAEHDAQEADRDAFYFDDERWSKYDFRN
ncbi:MAG: hypothetical protein JO250_15310 [Armatimonadetes bacterium]|nr:hypothetical protein [Armatimonadota bacterium]